MEPTRQAPGKMRLTPQRQVILEELAKVNSHPTASDIHDLVRARLPRIGLGTVYRNLELMAENGLILKLEISGTQKRYDATTDLHYHVRCLRCGRVDDIDMEPRPEIERIAAAETAYTICGHHVEFVGICPTCSVPAT